MTANENNVLTVCVSCSVVHPIWSKKNSVNHLNETQRNYNFLFIFY